MDKNNFLNQEFDDNFRSEIVKYFIFWPYILVSVIIFLMAGFIYMRYTEYNYSSTAKIEILDKAQDNEMSLPTAMTVFNRSMINLQNEIGVLKSFELNRRVINNLQSNVKFYTAGNIVTSENHKSNWFVDYKLDFKSNPGSIKIDKSLKFEIEFNNDGMNISQFDKNNDLVYEVNFQQNTTEGKSHSLPFELYVNDIVDNGVVKILTILDPDDATIFFKNAITVSESGNESDQLNISLVYPNSIIAAEYINTLVSEFDKDGVRDRQLEYQRTMDFVDNRSDFLNTELKKIENLKQSFKETNNLTNIESDANINVTQKLNYNSELFNAISQKDLLLLLINDIETDSLGLLPVNIGLENQNINSLISEYNLTVRERDKYLSSAGSQNSFVKTLNNQLNSYLSNISISIENYLNSLNLKIESLEQKEKEFSSAYQDIPENEKILRSIERELQIKESLFLLLLQKREEAAINFAVIKPSIKIIEQARVFDIPVSPNKSFILLFSLFLGLILPLIFLYIWFYLDDKIHTKEELSRLVSLPIIAEIPHAKDNSTEYQLLETIKNGSRDILSESIRMLIANLKFTQYESTNKSLGKVTLVTSSVKGEGKTLISSRLSKILSFSDKKVILLGADLRNPQLHKSLGLDKSTKGISDYIYRDDLNWKDLLVKSGNLEILLSGTIPPNPTELLNSKKFKELIDELRKSHDYIIIDSAPCLLVADTLQFSKHVDNSILVLRANHSTKNIIPFIEELQSGNRLEAISLVLNGVGNSQAYGYKYGYQYGYQYGYKYGYNYGYGYGYKEDK